ncbi:MAG: autotransporter-associated beta strand repeat-containing protein [Verrucomicrobia bacterium]|nr:autotransporter-associated beta strand repeat-containing protein [Verrucomicrobiota bacterium]
MPTLKVIRFLLAACVLGVGLVSTHAATYHLDAGSGNDSADGLTPGTAWQTLTKANSVVYQPGDNLLLKSGATWTGRLLPQGSGTLAARIVIDRYGDGPKPLIHGGGVSGGAVTLQNSQYWTIRNLEITNNGSSEPKKMGILVRNDCVGTLSGIEVRDCDIHDVTGVMTNYIDGKESGGIVFSITASNLSVPSKWQNIVIEGNTIRNVVREGILMQSLWVNKPQDPNTYWAGLGDYYPSENIRIASNTLENIGGDGIIPWCVKNSIIEYNLVRRSNNNSLGQGHAGLWPYICEDVIMQFNEVCETKTAYDGMALDFDNSDQRCIYQYNYSHDNEGGFLNMCCDGNGNGNIARYNISQNDGCIAGGRVFLVHGHGNHGYQVYNNTIFVSRNNPPMFEQGAASTGSDITFKNNIFINSGTGSFNAPGGCYFDNNLYHGNGHIAADPRKILANPMQVFPGSGANGLNSLDGYKLLAGSPALGSGLVIANNGGLDYWGNAVSSTAAPNIGAYNGSAAPPMTPSSGIWTQEAGGLWTAGGNWLGNSMAIGSDMTATIPQTTAVTVQQPIDDFPLGGFIFSGANHVVSGGSFLLNASSAMPSVEVAGGSSTIGSTLRGMAGLRKTGNGTLTLTGISTYSGGTVVDAGTLALHSTISDQSVIRGGLTVNPGASVAISGADYAGLGRTGGANVTALNINGGTVTNTIQSFLTGATVNLTYGAMNGGGFHIISSTLNSKASSNPSTVSSNLIVRRDYGSADPNIDVEDGSAPTDLLISGIIAEVFSSGLGKSGAGKLVLTGANAYTGTTNINAGTLSISGTGKIYTGSGWAARTVNVNASAVLEIDRWNGDGSLGQSDYRASGLVLNGGTLRYTGSETTTPSAIDGSTGRAFSLGVNGGTLESAAPPGYVFAITQYNGDPGTYALPAFNSTLTLAGSGNGYIGKILSGSGGVTKSGGGTWSLVRANAYTGPTTVLSGTLSLGDGSNKTNLANNAAVNISKGATLHLNYSGTDSVGSLTFVGIARPPGVYSAANSSFITGPGTLTVLTGPATDYEGWVAFHGLTGGRAGDDDHDGLTNLAEYAFGLDPNDGASAQPITSLPSRSTGTFTYTRRHKSLTGLTYTVWTSTNLTDWIEDTLAAQSPSAIPGTDIESVHVTLSPGPLNATRLFVRTQTVAP